MDVTFPYVTEADHVALNQVPTQKTLHFTVIFQAFVFMQVFNQINARKIFDGEFNVFEGIFKNPLFSIIVLITIIVQVIMVEIGGKAVKTYPLGMTENLWCLLIGFIEMPWGLLLKFLPLKWFGCLHINDTPPEGGVQELKGISTIVKSRSRVFDK
jgi:magnesium-transporting ATPase (P-type)